MSTLEVKAIQAPTGYDLQMPAGHILQTIQTSKDPQSISTSSSSFVSMGFSITITPSSTSSKILLQVHGGGQYLPIISQMAQVTIYRGSTNIGNATTGLMSHYTNSASAGTGMTISPLSMIALDSPNTTSATTYTIYAKTGGGVYQFHNADRGRINFVAQEVAG